jgi:hypothetical protein
VTENNIPSHTVASSIFTLFLKQPAQALMDTFISKASLITEVNKHFFTMVCSTNLNEATLGGPSGNQLKVGSILRLKIETYPLLYPQIGFPFSVSLK